MGGDQAMRTRVILAAVLTTYSALVIRLLVFKIDFIRIGHLRFRFAPRLGETNLIPFKTISSYLHGEPNWSIAILNLVGNIVLLAPIGFLVPLVYRQMTWRTSLALAAAIGLSIEGMEVLLRLGIFDIDDVILNALGVMLGYWANRVFANRARLI
jgi:glycopeptide antibiotics resistance protein